SQDPHEKPCALLPSATRNEAAFNQKANDNESATNLHRRGSQPATNLHPTSLTVADDHGPLMTMSDHDDTGQQSPTQQRDASPVAQEGRMPLLRFYSQVILPHLCDFLLGQPHVARHRRELLADAAGDVLEMRC